MQDLLVMPVKDTVVLKLQSFTMSVGRLLLPVIQNHTGSSTFSSRGLTLFQREEGVIVDTSLHGDTKEVRGTVLISAVVRALTCC